MEPSGPPSIPPAAPEYPGAEARRAENGNAVGARVPRHGQESAHAAGQSVIPVAPEQAPVDPSRKTSRSGEARVHPVRRRPTRIPGWTSLRRWQAILAALAFLGIGVAAGVLAGGSSPPSRMATHAPPGPPGTPGVYSGPLADGAAYEFQIPDHWNGTLLLYSHGYVSPGAANPATDIGDVEAGSWVLAHGYAVAGSSYRGTGWAVQDALDDQIATLDVFTRITGRAPVHVVAWGHSMGGLITIALAEKFPERITAALPMCGPLAGAGPFWDIGLAGMVAFKALLAPQSNLQVANITNPDQNLAVAQQAANQAQQTAQGRARLALVAALLDIPPAYDVTATVPSDAPSQEQAQFTWLVQNDLSFYTDLRAELEFRAGGNGSTDAGFDFGAAIRTSPYSAEVSSLYGAAGLSLDADIAALTSQPRIAAAPGPAGYLARYASVSGHVPIPVLTLHTVGDGLVPVDNESAFFQMSAGAGSEDMVRQAFVDRPGHCTFTSAESIAALQVLMARVTTGQWGATDPSALNARASSLGSAFQTTAAAPGTALGPSFTEAPAPYFPIPIASISGGG